MDGYSLFIGGTLILAVLANLYEIRMLSLSFVLLLVLGVFSPLLPDLESAGIIGLAAMFELVIMLAGLISKTRAGNVLAACSAINCLWHGYAIYCLEKYLPIPDYNPSLIAMESIQALSMIVLSRPVVSGFASVLKHRENRRNGHYRNFPSPG